LKYRTAPQELVTHCVNRRIMSTKKTDPQTDQTVSNDIQTYRFIDYQVYQESKKWFQEISSLRGVFETNTTLWHQLKAAMTSVVMNITAASTKLPSDARRYLGNAITSANKTVACLDIARDQQAITDEEFQTLSDGFQSVIIQLKRFIKALGSDRKPAATEAVPA